MMRRLLVVAITAIALILLMPVAASAHNAGGVSASNYKTVLESVTPHVPGVTVSIKELGDRIQLVNKNDTEVLVPGYSGEPYLRVSKNGVFTNYNSPAYFVNQSLNGSDFVPPTATATAAPDWHKTSSADLVTWHDHRVHWVSSITPADVKAAPDKTHVVIPQWTFDMQYGSQKIVATGHLSWIPAESAVPWYALSVVTLAVGIATAFHRRSPRLVAGCLVALIAIDVVHTAGLALAVAGTAEARASRAVGAVIPSAIAWFVGGYGALRLWRQRDDGPWYAIFAAVLIAALGGFSDLQSLNHSQLPFAWPWWIDRLAVAVSLGLGAGLFLSLLRLLHRQRRSVPVEQ